MTDRHLNLFYTYNRDTELLENNLTRAWIVAMQFLSPKLRRRLLDELFGKAVCPPESNPSKLLLSFETARFALQCHIDRQRALRCSRKYIVAMVGEREYDDGNSVGSGPSASEKSIAGRTYDSIPDAWIFDETWSYCFLIESKLGSNALADDQISSHAARWLALSEWRDHLIFLSWDDLANVLRSMLDEIICGRLVALEPEQLMLANLRDYLTFFGYRAFGGVALNAMPERPPFALGHRRGVRLPTFARLNAPPGFRLRCNQERTA